MNCDSYTVTTRPFWMKDPQAFEDEMKRLAEDSVLVVHQVAHEGLRGVSGGVTVVTPDRIKTVTLADVEQQLLHAGPLTDEAIRRLAVSILNTCGDVFYDPTEFGDPWDQEGPEGIEGATGRLLNWVTDNIEAGIREALRLYREASHVVVHVTPFDGESGVLVDGEVIYISTADSGEHAMSAGQVATNLANALGVEVVEVDLRQEMETLVGADRYDEATWDNVPYMVVEKLTEGGDK